ncbi:helix-turn-helix domain-containing protein [Methylobacterium sp. NEAU K]|uniref:helix-turn-helix domain-containing protein n=1 Tax=Methylobacterium sp. NEAU K TaxID=3064946 RepID=UPI002732DC30|nr:helix-turn-helix domain-containing protein [Methylobacterium sp. NEAU K]MDP4004546.1 helix-turn-helix domain-containing protein [Methylobacterium sp. NEAU K]
MQPLFSTHGLHPRDSFKRWREMLSELGATVELQRLDDGPFEARMEVARVGPIAMTRSTMGAVRSEAKAGLIPRHGSDGLVMATFTLAGAATAFQDERSSVQRPGDLVVIDHRPTVLTSSAGSGCLVLQLPRERLESVLGPTRLYTALTVGSDLGSTTLAMTFFQELIRVHHQLAPDAAARMASIGVDLIVASIAERLAQDVPRPLHGTVVVQRAKAHVEAHLSDPTLDPPQLAAAVGVSLRRLQELFHERGQHISDWIWQRRLEAAAKRLADPGCAHLPIGILSYGCGFANQAHFSRRFKERHGMSPREYRFAALLGAP